MIARVGSAMPPSEAMESQAGPDGELETGTAVGLQEFAVEDDRTGEIDLELLGAPAAIAVFLHPRARPALDRRDEGAGETPRRVADGGHVHAPLAFAPERRHPRQDLAQGGGDHQEQL